MRGEAGQLQVRPQTRWEIDSEIHQHVCFFQLRSAARARSRTAGILDLIKLWFCQKSNKEIRKGQRS